MPSDPGSFRASPEGLLVALSLKPNASRDGVEGLVSLEGGQTVLRLRVTAPPEGGKANTALVKLLAKSWKLPKSSLRLVAGHKSRRKTLLIAGEAAALRPRLEAWLADLPAK